MILSRCTILGLKAAFRLGKGRYLGELPSDFERYSASQYITICKSFDKPRGCPLHQAKVTGDNIHLDLYDEYFKAIDELRLKTFTEA
jgi:hypothetical protein